MRLPLSVALTVPVAYALKLFREKGDGSTYVSFVFVFLTMSLALLLIFALLIFAANRKRRSIAQFLGQELKYELLDFDNVGADWTRVPKEEKEQEQKSKKEGKATKKSVRSSKSGKESKKEMRSQKTEKETTVSEKTQKETMRSQKTQTATVMSGKGKKESEKTTERSGTEIDKKQ